ncbi:LuxR family transcriptional regulator, activator of conjugal transfer of Ti plasmids [Rhizobiales bacterium GAS113]|nr:LuxR family transcriptional regulator, activator of conjugal transfer of Ti plasmids [Rhizobiales bacterium GAS113]
MKHLEFAFQDLIDSLEIATDDYAFHSAADRLVRRLGFRWFAYLGSSAPALKVLSSYPAAWARRYLERGYEQIDAVVAEARSTQRAFVWDARSFPARSPAQRRLFWEASQFGIRCGVTVPIRGGYGRFAAFTLAGDEMIGLELFDARAADLVQLIALYYHANVHAKLQLGLNRVSDAALTPRERQCLTWVAQGKRMGDIADILSISRRTVVFHLDNARSKIGVATLAQAVAEAMQRGLIP